MSLSKMHRSFLENLGPGRGGVVLYKPMESVVRSQPIGARVQAWRAERESSDVYDELLKTKRLQDEGIISDEEYERLRRRLPGRLEERKN